MSRVTEFALAAEAEPPASPPPAALRWLHRAEDAALVLCLALLVLLPVGDLLARRGMRLLPDAQELTRHVNLLVGVFGALVAARGGRLLALSTLPSVLPPRGKAWAGLVGGAVGALVAAVLAAGAWPLLQFEREGAAELVRGLPRWWFVAAIPLGFGGLALRLAWRAGRTWKARLGALALILALAWLGGAFAGLRLPSPVAPGPLVLPAFVLLGGAVLLGTPIFAVLGGAAIILFWSRGEPLASLPVDFYEQVANNLLPAVPLFTLAGYFLAESAASKRLVRVFMAVFGGVRGGPAVVTALTCAFFTTFTGGSGVTILALGGLLLPVLLAARYSERQSLGLITGAGSLGILFPPCLPVILYALVAQTSARAVVERFPDYVPPTIAQMYLGGLLPGLLLVGLVAAWGVWLGRRNHVPVQRFNGREAGAAVWDAKWEISLPVVALTALFSGLAQPVEAAALTALYAFFITAVIRRDLKLTKDVPRVMVECGLLVGGVLLILGVAMGFTNFLISAQVPDQAVDWVTARISSPLLFLLVLNLLLILVGCLMDIYSAIIVMVPLIVPLGAAFGIDPVHLGIIFLANLELGYLTPPVGMNLFLSSYRFKKPLPEVTRAALPVLGILLVGVLLITYWPALTTWLPGRFGR
ncbi:MAG: TRAP transporter large permease subunit [Limisphaerales bacterium]